MTNSKIDAAETDNVRQLAGYTGLRLISSSYGAESMGSVRAELASVPCLVLKSAMASKNVVIERELTALFQSLRPGERIEFSHSLHRDELGNPIPGHPYRLSIRVAAQMPKLENLKLRVSQMIASSFPELHFVADDALPMAGLPYTEQYALSGVVATEKPAAKRFATDWGSSATLTGVMNAGAALNRYVLPFAEDLPSWAFTAPFNESLVLPHSSEINIRIHGFCLDDEKCEGLHRTLFRLQSGNLSVFHPRSPIAFYSAAPQFLDSSVERLRHWLQHPDGGYALDCVLRSSSPMSEAARQRIVGDVFGKRHFECVRTLGPSSQNDIAVPEFSWAIGAGQGLPALIPAPSMFATLEVPRHYSVPTAMPPSAGSRIGSTVCGLRSTAVHLPMSSRSRHVAVVGSTGCGKSSLFTQMMAADIADPERSCGVGLIDPHGSLYQRVLELVPRSRADDVVLIDTSDLLSTTSLNPLEGMKDDPLVASFIVSEIMSLVDLLFEGRDTSGPIAKSNLRNLLLLTAGAPGRNPCLLDALRILEDKDYAEYLMSKCKDRNVVDYWRSFMKTSSSSSGYTEWAPYMLARLSPFVASPIMKRLISRPDSTIDLGQAMQERKIVLFNLNKGVLNEIECQVLGSLVLSKFFGAALGRSRMPEAQRVPFHLYVDEAASFANDATPRLFSEARKFGLCLNVAFQSLSQLENRWGRSNIAASVLANTATKMIMRLGPADLPTMEPYFQPQFEAGELTSLPDFHAVACMSDINRPLPPFVLKVDMATPDPEAHASVKDLEALSRARYAVPIEQANRELARIFELDVSTLGSKQIPLEPVEAKVNTVQESSAQDA